MFRIHGFPLYCIVSIHLCSASCSAHQSEALPVRETQREEPHSPDVQASRGSEKLHKYALVQSITCT